MKILVLDNYDSFTYNLVQMVEEITGILPDVFRNDKIELESVLEYDKIILSPGPGLPSESGILMDLIHLYSPIKDIGAKLFNLDRVMHGVATPIQVIQPDILFENMPDHFNTGRYHSWAIEKENFPESLMITAIDNNGVIMALKHKKYKVRGVQFHPESVLTEHGVQMMKNWLNS
jgi:anthranilate synthase component 2